MPVPGVLRYAVAVVLVCAGCSRGGPDPSASPPRDVSGVLVLPAGAAGACAAIALDDDTDPGNGFASKDGAPLLRFLRVSSEAESYVFPSVPDGRYWLVAMVDLNGDASAGGDCTFTGTAGPGDLLGYHGGALGSFSPPAVGTVVVPLGQGATFPVVPAPLPDANLAVTACTGADAAECAFPETPPASTATGVLTLRNAGPGSPLVIYAVGSADGLAAPFSIVADTCTGSALAVDATCTLTIEFAPIEAGTFSDSFSVRSNAAGGGTSTVAVSGSAEPLLPSLSVFPGSGCQPAWDGAPPRSCYLNPPMSEPSRAGDVVVKNLGPGAPLVVSDVGVVDALDSPFWLVDECSGTPLGVQQSCNIRIYFTAPVPGVYFTDTFTFATNDPANASVTVVVGGSQLPPPPVVCGDGVRAYVEEGCDAGDLRPFDGCSETCQLEAACAGGACAATCGDGLKFAQEECDDGNLAGGDGCSESCTVETGWSCAVADVPVPGEDAVPILYRDLLFSGTSGPADGHPDFEAFTGGLATGLVSSALGSDSEPVWASNRGSGSADQLTGAVSFCWWFHDAGCEGPGTVNPFAVPVYVDLAGSPTTLGFTEVAPGTYRYASGAFFALDALGWNDAAGQGPAQVTDGHNYSFTAELHVPFTHRQSASSAVGVTADDDTWVFVNGRLAIDLGGVHGAASGAVTLDAATADALGLADGGTYSLDVFHAERHTAASELTLTLSGFTRAVSQCVRVGP